MTVKGLGEELVVIKEQLKEIQSLKQTVLDLKKEVQELKSKQETTNTEGEEFRCRKCDESFKCLKLLKQHLLEVHPKALSCEICNKAFFKNHELEEHMEEHVVAKNFKCDICKKEFYLEWRFKKHANVHSDQAKICKNFSRGVTCPFEQVGCKFKHEEPVPPLDMSTDATVDDDNGKDGDENEVSEEVGENQCHLCMKQLIDRSDLLDHFRTQHVHFYTLMNNRSMS